MILRLWDFSCECGKQYRDYPVYESRIPNSIACECGQRATWAAQRTNHIHPTLSTRKYGEFDPQFGCVVEDYAHKQRLMRELNMVEVGEFDKEEVRDNALPSETRTDVNATDVMAADTLEEITAAIDADRIDRSATGADARDKPLHDSWGNL